MYEKQLKFLLDLHLTLDSVYFGIDLLRVKAWRASVSIFEAVLVGRGGCDGYRVASNCGAEF